MRACQPFAEIADIDEHVHCNLFQLETDEDRTEALDDAADLVWHLTGRVVHGICSATIRPCGPHPCPSGNCYLPVIHLEYPVVEITEVKIDGAVLDPAEYRVDEGCQLVRLRDTVTRRNDGWPAYQHLDLPATEPDTFEITYTFGRPVPSLIRRATLEVADDLAKDILGGQPSSLRGAVSATSQGTSVRLRADAVGERAQAEAEAFPFLRKAMMTYNPDRRLRPTLVYSPDLQDHHVTG